jgi:hypothetical protein
MLSPEPLNIITFKTSKDLSQWLEVNNATERELWVKVFKKKYWDSKRDLG